MAIKHVEVLTLALCVPLGTACAGENRDSPPARVETVDTIDGMVIVSGDTPLPEAVSMTPTLDIGLAHGDTAYVFGSLQTLTVGSDGAIFAFDQHVPALRQYDADGRYVRTIGRSGEGPGEYGRFLLGLVALQDGRVVLWDRATSRVNTFRRDGELADSWLLPTGVAIPDGVTLLSNGHLVFKVQGRRTSPVLIETTVDGQLVDTLTMPSEVAVPPTAMGAFESGVMWRYSPLGYYVLGHSGQYTLRLVRGNRVEISIDQFYEPVPLRRAERADHEAHRRWMNRNQGQFLPRALPAVPEVKPVFKALYVGESGRIWTWRHTSARRVGAAAEPGGPGPPSVPWLETPVLDVFAPSGRYVMSVQLPDRTTPVFMRGDTVWAIGEGDAGEHHIRRFRR